MFPLVFKLVDIIPVHKKTQKAWKAITYLPVFSVISPGYMKSSCLNKFWNFLNHFYGDIIVDLLIIDQLLTDLSKVFECLFHDLLFVNLNTYWFSIAVLRLAQNDLSDRKQRTKINSDFSSWEEILLGVPQGYILGTLLFNIFLCDFFFIMNDTDFGS